MADRARHRPVAATLSALLTAVLLAGGVLALSGVLGSPDGAGADAAGRRAATGAEVVARVRPGQPPAGSPSPRRGRAPTAVVVPALGVAAPVDRIALQGRSLTPPADPTRIGWWGARPGAGTGTTVLTGHTVHTGGGAFDRLEDLGVGDVVTVRTGRGPLDYRVRSVRVLSRQALARRSGAIFTQAGPSRLVLVTCEDWDGTAYRSNVVVTARPAG